MITLDQLAIKFKNYLTLNEDVEIYRVDDNIHDPHIDTCKVAGFCGRDRVFLDASRVSAIPYKTDDVLKEFYSTWEEAAYQLDKVREKSCLWHIEKFKKDLCKARESIADYENKKMGLEKAK